MNNLFDDFLLYRDSQGLNQNATDGKVGITSQNGTLFTTQYLICLLASSDITPEQKQAEINRISDVFFDLQTESGLSIRFKGSTEFDSMDNTCALLTFSNLYDQGVYADAMYDHGVFTRADGIDEIQDAANNEKFYKIAKILSLGREPRWFFNNQRPTKFCNQGWFGRSPAMIGLIKMASDLHYPNPFNWISVLVGQFLGCTAPASNTDARTLAYVNWQFLKKRSFVWNLFYKLWCWQLFRVYPNGMKDVYSQYFGPTHPIAKYSNPY